VTSGKSCSACATPLPRDAAFCPACGTATPAEFEPASGTAAAPAAGLASPPADAAARRAQLQRALGAGFELKELVGQGGFGEVWAAWDVRLKRDVAVKVLLADLAASPGLHTRFAREAEAAARLRHPNIVPIYQVGEADGLAYIIMPLVQGESLRAVLQREGALPIAVGRRMLAEAARALEAAHKAGLVHRDVKPENIMLEGEERRVLLMDFGIARAMEEGSARLTGTGLVIGTPQYMSPEQATAEKHIDHRADIYSLGVVAYEALTGTVPFEADSTRDLIVHHLTKDPRDPRATRAEIPEDVADAILKCLAKEPDDRWASAGALAQVLQPPVTTTEESPLKWITRRLRSGVRKSRRRIVIYATALAAVLATLALFNPGSFGASVSWWQWRVSTLISPPARTAEAQPGEANPWHEWSQATNAAWGVNLDLSSLGDSLLLAHSPGSGPLLFDGHGWRVLPIEPGTDRGFVQPALRARDGTAWIYVVRGAFTVGYQLTGTGPVARDTVRGQVLTLWSDGRGALLGLADGGLLRGQPGAWRREATGTHTRLGAIWGDSARQFALGYFAGVGRPDSLLVFNGLNWGTVDPRPGTTRHWVYNTGAVLSDGTFIVAGQDCGAGRDDCRGLIARLTPGASRWAAMAGMPDDVDFRAMVVSRTDELWLVGLGDGCPGLTCAYRVARDTVQAQPDFGRHPLNGLALLGGEPLAMTTGGTVWVHRTGQWGLLGVVPGSLATGIVPGGGIFEAATWSEGTVVRPGVAGVRRVVELRIPGRATVWLAQQPLLRYEFPCAAGESLTVSIRPAGARTVHILDPGGRSIIGGQRTTGTVRWLCPDARRYRVAVPATQDGQTAFTLGLHHGWPLDSLPALPPHAGPAGTIAVGRSVTGNVDDGARLLTAWLTTAGAVLARACDARLRCTEPAELRAPGPVRDITGLGDAFLAASGGALYAHRGQAWQRMAAEGPLPPVLALTATDSAAAALTEDTVWRLAPGAASWRRWLPVPPFVGRPRRIALAPDGRAALVLGELSVALLREGMEPRELRITTSPSDGVILPDGRVVLALPSGDPLVGGHLAVFNEEARRVEQAAPGRRNVWALTLDGPRLFATASGWTTLAIDVAKLPLAGPSVEVR
jgi:serine/threonine protein kinase